MTEPLRIEQQNEMWTTYMIRGARFTVTNRYAVDTPLGVGAFGLVWCAPPAANTSVSCSLAL